MLDGLGVPDCDSMTSETTRTT